MPKHACLAVIVHAFPQRPMYGNICFLNSVRHKYMSDATVSSLSGCMSEAVSLDNEHMS